VAEDDVVAGGEGEQQRRLRAEARGERERGRRSLERGDGLLERLSRRIPGAAVVEALRLSDLRLCVRGRLEDRNVDRSVRRFGLLALVDRAGLEPHRIIA